MHTVAVALLQCEWKAHGALGACRDRAGFEKPFPVRVSARLASTLLRDQLVAVLDVVEGEAWQPLELAIAVSRKPVVVSMDGEREVVSRIDYQAAFQVPGMGADGTEDDGGDKRPRESQLQGASTPPAASMFRRGSSCVS